MKTVSLRTPLLSAAFAALAAFACTTPVLPAAESSATPAESAAPAGSSSSNAPDAATAPPVPAPDAGRRICSLVGCISDLTLLAHVALSPAELAKGSSFHLCYRGACWDGTFTAPSSPKAPPQCKVTPSPMPKGWCNILPERDAPGAIFTVGIMEAVEGDFVDGDRISLRLSVGGKPRIDVHRRILYSEWSPNGAGCSPTCSGATVELWPESRSDVTCASQECDAVVRFASTLPHVEDAMDHSTLTACKNGHCKTSEVKAFWYHDKNEQPVAAVGGGVEGVDGSTMLVKVDKGGRHGIPMPFTIEFRGDPARYKNGDDYLVEWKSKTGSVLVSERRVVTYDESEPGGPGCSPVMCKRKVF